MSFSFQHHPRSRAGSRYVYCVLSRRAMGLSIGLNFNPDKLCNYDCPYCQVERDGSEGPIEIDEAVLHDELRGMFEDVASGRLVQQARDQGVPERFCKVAEIAIAGDGEPCANPRFVPLLDIVMGLRRETGLDLPVFLFTNATLLHRSANQSALASFYEQGGCLVAKLDAGTADYFAEVSLSRVKFDRVLRNLRDAAIEHPMIVQSLFYANAEVGPSDHEIAEYAERLGEIADAGGKLRAVQVMSIARKPAQDQVRCLTGERLGEIGEAVFSRVPGICVEVILPDAKTLEGPFGPLTQLRPRPT